MFDEPSIEQRAEQPYVALSTSITMQGYGTIRPMFDDRSSGWRSETSLRRVCPLSAT